MTHGLTLDDIVAISILRREVATKNSFVFLWTMGPLEKQISLRFVSPQHFNHCDDAYPLYNNYRNAAHVFFISFVFSNARRVLSQCNTRVGLLYLLNIPR